MSPRQESLLPPPDFDFSSHDIGSGQTRDNVNGSRNHPGLAESLVDVVTDRAEIRAAGLRLQLFPPKLPSPC
jgi:hypothetical protein